MITVNEVIRRNRRITQSLPIPSPMYLSPEKEWRGIGLAVEDMSRDVTDEGIQIFKGLEDYGYTLYGFNLHKEKSRRKYNETDIPTILKQADPTVVVIQDHREWDPAIAKQRDKRFAFTRDKELSNREDIFKLTIIKDAHQRPLYHRECARTIGCNAWITYYHPAIISHLAPYVRPQHLIRTYHTIDPLHVPSYTPNNRMGLLVSGALGTCYPLRQRLVKNVRSLYKAFHIGHPGYSNRGCHTQQYIRHLSKFRMAACTSSIYSYALRKIFEATAAGCVVLTDLTSDDILPHINSNLVRIHPEASFKTINENIQEAVDNYDPERQEWFSKLCIEYYSYQAMAKQLHHDIEMVRMNYEPTLARNESSTV